MRFAAEAAKHMPTRRDRRAAPRDEGRRARREQRRQPPKPWAATFRSTPSASRHRRPPGGAPLGARRAADDPPRRLLAGGLRSRRPARARTALEPATRADGRPREPARRLAAVRSHRARRGPDGDRDAVRQGRRGRLRALPGARAPPRRQRLRRARRRGHDRRVADADRRREARALGRGRRRGRRTRDGDREHRHLLDGPFGAPDRAGARARRGRLPRRHAVLQQAAAARDRRALQGDRGRRATGRSSSTTSRSASSSTSSPRRSIELAEIPSVQAVKQATEDLDQARRIVAETDLALYAGSDHLALPVPRARRRRRRSSSTPTSSPRA